MRGPLSMILTFALTLALSVPGRAQQPSEGVCVNVSVALNVSVEAVAQLMQGTLVSAVNVSVNVALDVDGGVDLAWETGTEPDTAGFNVYRADGEGSYTQLNDALIPAQPDPASGRCGYTFADRPGQGKSHHYMLESMGIDGKRKHRALVSVPNP
jgi:hypothetical protein